MVKGFGWMTRVVGEVMIQWKIGYNGIRIQKIIIRKEQYILAVPIFPFLQNNGNRKKTTAIKILITHGVIPEITTSSSIDIKITPIPKYQGISTLTLHRLASHLYPTVTASLWKPVRRTLLQRKWIPFDSNLTLYLKTREKFTEMIKLSLFQTKDIQPYLGW